MSNSKTSICSNASLMLGGNAINDVDNDTTARARLASNLFPTISRYVLAQHPWACCRTRTTLNPDSTTPAFDWNYQYTLPGDFQRIIGVGQEGMEVPYVIESDENGARKLLCDDAPLYLRYSRANDNVGSWDDLLVTAVTMAMRQVMAYPLTQSASLEQLIDQAIEPILMRARSIDAQNQPPEVLGDYRLLSARNMPARYSA